MVKKEEESLKVLGHDPFEGMEWTDLEEAKPVLDKVAETQSRRRSPVGARIAATT